MDQKCDRPLTFYRHVIPSLDNISVKMSWKPFILTRKVYEFYVRLLFHFEINIILPITILKGTISI